MKSIGILLPGTADDPVFQARLAAFYQELALLGWTIGRNVRIEPRWATANADELRRHAGELAALGPDVILATVIRLFRRCCKRPAPSQSCFHWPPIRSGPVSLIAWRAQAAMLPAS